MDIESVNIIISIFYASVFLGIGASFSDGYIILASSVIITLSTTFIIKNPLIQVIILTSWLVILCLNGRSHHQMKKKQHRS